MQNQGCRKIAANFNRLYEHHKTHSCCVSKSFVATVIKENQNQLLEIRRNIKNKKPREIAVNKCWAMDLSFYKNQHQTNQTFLGIIDHGSRLAITLQTLMSKNSWILLGYLFLAIGKYGKPKMIRTDNEPVFTSFVFRYFLDLFNIKHQRIKTYSPWQNGRIERLFGTLKPLLKQLVIPNKEPLQNKLDEFKLFYNHIRPHQNLNDLTPAEKWNGYSSKDIQQNQPKQIKLVKAFNGLLIGYWIRR